MGQAKAQTISRAIISWLICPPARLSTNSNNNTSTTSKRSSSSINKYLIRT